MGIFQRQLIIKSLASGFYAGYSPVAPGTVGSLIGVIFAYLLLQAIPSIAYITIVILIFISGVYIAGKAEKIYQEEDSPRIVIDEIAGMLFAYIYLPKGIEYLLAGFIAFRIFDILKPFPIRSIESKFSGGWGIMSDDILAAVYANLLVRLLGWVVVWL